MPFRVVRPFLEQCRSDQLLEIEESSPHLLPDTQPIWRRNCLRDFSELRKLDQDEPLESDDWRALYLQKQQQADQARKLAMERIRGRYAEHRAQKDAKKTIVSETTLYPTRQAARRAHQKPLTALQSRGQAMINRARTGSAVQVRRGMLIPPRRNMRPTGGAIVRQAPVKRPPSDALGGDPKRSAPAAGHARSALEPRT